VRIDKTTVTIAGLGGVAPSLIDTNLALNPSFEVSTAGWYGNTGGVGLSRAGTGAGAPPGAWCARATNTTNVVAIGYDGDIPAKTGDSFTVSAWVYKDTAGLIYAMMQTWDAGGGYTGEQSYREWDIPAATWVRIYVQAAVAAPAAAEVRPIFQASQNEPYYIDAVMVTRGMPAAPPAYFDGDTLDVVSGTASDVYAWSGTPHGSTSTHTVVPVTDATCWVDHVTIRHGREDYGEQAEADTTTVELSPDHTGAAVPSIEIGADLLITHQVTDTGPVFTRFRGRVSDVSRTWDEAGEATPDQGLCQVVAVSSLGELGRRLVGDEPWPQELDGARALRILRLAYPTLPATNVDPGIYQVIPRDVDRQDALALTHEAAEAGGGLLWSKAGDPFPYYADFEHRRGTVAALELDACDILAAPTWSRDLSGLCNYVSLTYGVAPAEGEAPSLTSRNQPSVDKFGEYGLSVTLALANQADAQARANLLTTRNGTPEWVLTELPLAMSELDPATTETLLGLDTHSLMLLTGLPAAGSAPTSAYVWVEGWSEEFAAGLHELVLSVSGYCATSPPVRWNDVPPETTWDTASGSWTWDSVICIGPTPNRGRWDDVPATTRWDTVSASITWDTWKG
jgi:hypothetical protein